MRPPPPPAPQDEMLAEEVANITMKIARPLIWHDVRKPWPKRPYGATCFIIRVNDGLIGITANHVVEAFEADARGATDIVCRLRTAPFDLTSATICRDADLDIATFRVTEAQLTESEAIAVDCRSSGWPPPDPDIGREISLGGFPEALAVESPQHRVEFNAFIYLARIEDVTQRDIIATYDPQRDSRIRAAPELPELGANLSGCCGGPVLIHVLRNGCHRWFPAGLIIGSLSLPGFDTFRFRRVHFVNADGSIDQANSG